MRSTAHLKGHPVHPMLIPLPFAFLLGSVGFDLAGRLAGRREWCRTAASLQGAGLVSAAVAAVPGVIDYLFTVPPRSSGAIRATQHGLANLSALALFGGARAGRRSPVPTVSTLALEAAGAALLCVAGWLGGTLVYRNEIGVDVRQAGAGKWRETSARLGAGATFVAGRAGELGPNQMKLVHVGGRRIVIARTATGYVAFDDRCTHKGGSLAGGALVNGVVQCPWHGSQFDARSGSVESGPADAPITTYPVDDDNGTLRVRL